MGTRIKPAPPISVYWDHPHAYGDKVRRINMIDKVRGSSPRVWGQASIDSVHHHIREDHPHAYGDKHKVFEI